MSDTEIHVSDVKYSTMFRKIVNTLKKKSCVTIDNNPVTNRKYIANGFNRFFVSIGPKLAKDIHSNINPLTYVHNINDSIAVFDVSCVEQMLFTL